MFAGNLRRAARVAGNKRFESACLLQNSWTMRESIFQRSVGFCVCVSLGRCTWLIGLFFRGVKAAHRLPEILFSPRFYRERVANDLSL